MRPPSAEEARILASLLHQAGIDQEVSSMRVETMSDGGMGSLKLGSGHERRSFGAMVADKQYTDLDGVPFIASLYVDKNGQPYELDIWKVDFSPTKMLQKD